MFRSSWPRVRFDSRVLGRHARPPVHRGVRTCDSPSEGSGVGILLAIDLRNAAEILRPRDGRLTPDLFARWQRRSLVEAADAQRVGGRVLDCSRIRRGAAVRAERVCSLGSALCCPDVALRLPAKQPKALRRGTHGHSIRRSGEHLTVCAMAGRNVFRIDLSLVHDPTAMALSSNLHDYSFGDGL